jgi:glycosyltransferase involved in cell wall biosynthesis
VLGNPGGPMKVAIIVPCRDRIDSLHKCISSIEQSIAAMQDSSELAHSIRTLIVNDRSSADFGKTVTSLHPKVSVVDAEGIGPGAARNTGLKEADDDIYLFTDSDCVVSEDWCLKALAWHKNTHSTMAQGVPWLFQRIQNPQLGAREESLYTHMFSSYISENSTSMIDSRNLMLSREHFDKYPRKVFAETAADATAESRILLGGLLQKGLRIDWRPEFKVFHEDPRDLHAAWRQKYRHGSGRYYIWPDPPSTEFLLDRYFLSPILSKNDPDYVVPAHIAFLIGYREARAQNGLDRSQPNWWSKFHRDLLHRVERADYWSERVENEVCPRIKENG